MKRKITAVIAAAYIASIMSVCAYAQPAAASEAAEPASGGLGEAAGDVIDGVGDGIQDAADGIGNAAGDVLDGVGDALTGGADETPAVEDPVDNDLGELTEITDDDDIEDDLDDNALDYGKDDETYEAELYTDNNDNDPNPATAASLPFMASIISVTAAGVAYLTKKRNAENGQ